MLRRSLKHFSVYTACGMLVALSVLPVSAEAVKWVFCFCSGSGVVIGHECEAPHCCDEDGKQPDSALAYALGNVLPGSCWDLHVSADTVKTLTSQRPVAPELRPHPLLSTESSPVPWLNEHASCQYRARSMRTMNALGPIPNTVMQV